MRFYMAWAENTKYLKILHDVWAKNILLSFFYLRWKKHEKIVEILSYARSYAESIFLDSWAHTLIVAFWQDAKRWPFKNSYWGKLDLQQYISDFFDFITKYHQYFDAIAELDIWIIPQIWYEKVKEWREYMKKLWLLNKMVVVMHYNHFTTMLGGWKDEWRNILREYPKVALWDWPEWYVLKEIFDIRKEEWHNNKIHWFAETKLSKVTRCPYYSVDSTSRQQWLRFNQYLIFLNGKFRHYSANDFRKKYWIDLAKMPTEKKIKMNFKAYQDMEKRTTALQKAKWITRDD
jgi:hypothetical protein